MAPSPTAIKQSPDGLLKLTAIPEFENMDAFDVLPDPLLLIIFNFVSDVKTLIRFRVISKRFNSLVPQTESLVLKINSVVSPEAGDADSSLLSCLNSILKSLHNLVAPRPHQTRTQRPLSNSPAQILRDFQTIRDLDVEMPSGDMQVEKDAVVMWRAEFGRTLKCCVIFGFRETGTSPPTRIPLDFSDGFAGGLKVRVVWTIGALVAASSRHYLLKEVVKEQKQLASLVVRDKEGQGMVVMDKDGLNKFREALEEPDASDAYKFVIGEEGGQGEWERKTGGRTMVPDVKLRMRHALKMDVEDGAWVGGATLVIVKPTTPTSTHGGPDSTEVDVEPEELNNGTQQQGMEVDVEEEEKDSELVMETFGRGVHGPAVRALLKKRGFLMELNSF